MSKIQVKRAASTVWTAGNPVLSPGEFGFATEGILKIGDGVQAWNALSSIGGGAGGGVGLNTAATQVTWTVNSSGISLNAGAYLTTAAPSNHSHSLNQILDPSADRVFAMGTNHLQFQFAGGGSFSTNATRQGLFEIDANVAMTDGADVVHIHNTLAPAAVDLLHLEGAGTAVTLIRLSAGASIAAEINAPLKFTSGSVPLVLGTSQSNLVSNLNANYLQGKVSSEFQSTGAYLTTAANTTHSHGNPTLALTNLAGTTASASSGLTISLSHNISTAAQSDHSHGNPTLALTNLSGTTASASNGLTLSLAAAAPGGGATMSFYSPPWAVSGRATNSSLGQNTIYFQPFDLPYYLSASRINFYVSISGAMSAANSTGTCYQCLSYALYTLNATSASTATLNRLTSYGVTHLSHSFTSHTRYQATHYFGLSNATSHSTQQTALSATNATTYLSTNINGPRVIALPVNSVLTPGRYWLAFAVSTIAGNAMTNNLSVFHTSVGVQPAVYHMGSASAATNASVFRAPFGFGSYSATSGAFPATVAMTTDDIRYPVAYTMIHFDILGHSMSTNVI